MVISIDDYPVSPRELNAASETVTDQVPEGMAPYRWKLIPSLRSLPNGEGKYKIGWALLVVYRPTGDEANRPETICQMRLFSLGGGYTHPVELTQIQILNRWDTITSTDSFWAQAVQILEKGQGAAQNAANTEGS